MPNARPRRPPPVFPSGRQRVGKAGYVGGQEDMIIDIALQLQAERELQEEEGAR